MFRSFCSFVLFIATALSTVGFSLSNKVVQGKAESITKQLVQYLNIDLAKFILNESPIPQPFLLQLATSKREYVKAELHKQKNIYLKHIVDKLSNLTDHHLELSVSRVPDLIEEELDEQLQEFISVFAANTHDIMHVSKLQFMIRNSPQILLDKEYGIDVVVSDDKDNAIDSITLFTPKEELHSYFEKRGHLLSGLRNDLLFTPYHYVLNTTNGVHLFSRKLDEHKFLRTESLATEHQLRKVIPVSDNLVAVSQSTGENETTVEMFGLSPLAKMETLTYRGKLLLLSSVGRLAAVWNDGQLSIYNGNSKEFSVAKEILGADAEPIMAQFIEAEQQLVVVLADSKGGHKLVALDLKQERVIAIDTLPERPLQILIDGNSSYVLTANYLLRFDADGELAYQQKLQHASPMQLYNFDGGHLVLIYKRYLQILRQEDGGEDFVVYVGDRFHVIDHTTSDRYASLLIEKIVHGAEFSLTLVQIPVTRIIDMFKDDELLKLAPYAILDLSHSRTLPLIWNGRTLTLQ